MLPLWSVIQKRELLLHEVTNAKFYMYLNKKLIYRFLSKVMSPLPINFLHLLQLNPAPLSFLSKFYVAISLSSLKKATSLACVIQLTLLYFAPCLSFSISFFPALRCYQMLDPTSAGCIWRSATAQFSGTGKLCGQEQREHHCRHSHAPEHGFLPPVLSSPSSAFQVPIGMWPLIICSQLQSPFMSLKVDATSLPGQSDLGEMFSERIPRQPKWKRDIWPRHKVLGREGYPPGRAGSAYLRKFTNEGFQC